MSVFILSRQYPEFAQEIKKYGDVIFTDKITQFLFPEQYHADMQVFKTDNTIFILNECYNLYNELKELNNYKIIKCKNKAGEKYPKNILLNFLLLNNTLYGRLSAIDPNLLDYCRENNISTVDVKQGYCRCSVAVVSNNAVITADENIFLAMKENGVDVLKISPGYIKLEGFEYGFIGGASGKISENTLAFFGNIKAHPDYEKIKIFCIKHGVNIKTLRDNLPLTDIGGMIKLG